MKEIIARMYKTLLLKRFRSKEQADIAIVRSMSKLGQSRQEAITLLYVDWVDRMVGLSSGLQKDSEDEEQARQHEQM